MTDKFIGTLELSKLLEDLRKLYDDPSLDFHTIFTIECVIVERMKSNNEFVDVELERLNREVE